MDGVGGCDVVVDAVDVECADDTGSAGEEATGGGYGGCCC